MNGYIKISEVVFVGCCVDSGDPNQRGMTINCWLSQWASEERGKPLRVGNQAFCFFDNALR